LLLVGRRVFARDGFVNMRMSDVAKEANISLGVLYR
jgi:AcrR family transcriptional regulator